MNEDSSIFLLYTFPNKLFGGETINVEPYALSLESVYNLKEITVFLLRFSFDKPPKICMLCSLNVNQPILWRTTFQKI